MRIYPLKLMPIVKNAIWGGKQLSESFDIGVPGSFGAEAWMLSLRQDGQDVNIIENGCCSGMSLSDYTAAVGSDAVYGKGVFPLLIKLIDAADRLSVQVHPDDAYAAANGLGFGKTEMWYVLHAEPGASLVSGVAPGVTAAEIIKAAKDGTCEELLNVVPVKPGDCFFIPAGLVHAIGAGIVVAEIQQNSNTTFRLYDYDRTDKNGNKRELHTERAAEVIKTAFDLNGVTLNKLQSAERGTTCKTLCSCGYFTAQSLSIEAGSAASLAKDGHMLHVMCVSGRGYLEFGNVKYLIRKGDSYLLPKALPNGSVFAENALELILSH